MRFATLNKVPVTVDVTIIDKNDKTMSLSKELNGFETEPKIENVDFSSLADGELSVKVSVKDNNGNIIHQAATSYGEIEKKSGSPMVQYTSVKRTSATQAQIKGLIKTDTTDTVYCLVKAASEAKPTVNEVINNTVTTPTPLSSSSDNGGDKTVTFNYGEANKEYVAYIVVKTTKGTKSSDVMAVNIPSLNATVMDQVVAANISKKASTQATFVWNYDESKAGLTGYKAILKKNNVAVAEKTIKLGEEKEVDFFADMKKAGDGTYSVAIVALGNGVNYEDSVETLCTTTVTVDKVTNSVTVTTPDKGTTLLKWNAATGTNVTNISDYTLEIAKYNAISNTYETVKTVNTLETSYDIKEIVEENGIGEYVFKVTANAKEDILMVSTPSVAKVESSTIKYLLAEGISDLAVTDKEQTSITLTGTLLPKIYSGTTVPTYTLYCKKASETSWTSKGAVTKFPVSVLSLDAGTEYSFKLVTTTTSGDWVSNEVTAKTTVAPTTITTANPLTYKKYEATNAADPTAKFTADNQIAYNEGKLYIRNTGTTVTEYSTEVEGVADIISLLSELTVDTTTLEIKNNKISKLTFTTPTTEAKTYDLTNVSKDAEVTVKGNLNKIAVLKGTIKTLTLETAANVDLSALTVKSGITVKGTGSILLVANNTKLTPDTAVKSVTVNDVSITTTVAPLKTITAKSNVFDIEGDDTNKLTVDSSKANNAVTLNFVTTEQKDLDLIANANYATKITNSTTGTGALTIKAGKVDLSDVEGLPFTTVKAATNSTPETIVTIVTEGKALEPNHQDDAIDNATATALVNGSGLKFQASAAGTATYSTTKDSSEVKLRIKSGTVAITRDAE